MLVRRAIAITGLFATVNFASAASLHSVQVGAFKSESEAIKTAVSLESAGHQAVQVRPEESKKSGLLYKVLVGSFSTRSEAAMQQQQLSAAGVKGYVRTLESLDNAAVRDVLSGKTHNSYFADANIHFADTRSTTTLPPELIRERKDALGEATTSSKSLKNYHTFVNALDDEDQAKAAEIITFARYSFSGKSAYDTTPKDFAQVNALLHKVATGETNATKEHKLVAREILAHSLHYYSRDYANAIAAYRQILAERIESGDLAKAAKARMEIAAASYEFVKTSGFDRDEFLDSLSALWADGVQMQRPVMADGVTTGMHVRNHTICIGLMLSEVLIEAERFDEAREIANSLVEMYEPFPKTNGYRAEAYCHLAAIAIQLNDSVLCDSSLSSAIELSKKVGRVWGDQSRDPLWKAYTYKLAAAHHFKKSKLAIDLIKSEMGSVFPEHPDLHKYIGETAQ